jgi:hypothetical protein
MQIQTTTHHCEMVRLALRSARYGSSYMLIGSDNPSYQSWPCWDQQKFKEKVQKHLQSS